MPYKHGFSEESIHHNIALFIREGYPQDQAVAMALDIARKAWRREHPRGKYPAHLKGMRGPRKRRRNRASRRRRTSASEYVAIVPIEDVPRDFRMTEAEYQATHVLDGMAYRLRDEYVSERTRVLQGRYDRSVQIQDQDGIRRNGRALVESTRDDQYQAVMSVRRKSK